MLRLLGPVFVAAVALVALTHAVAGTPSASQVALTPDRLAAGKLWLLATSAFLVSGPVIPELAGLTLSVVAAQRLLGARAFALVAPACHVGATLLAYGLLVLLTGDADGSHNRHLDYGISAVWLGLLGALFARCLPAARRGNRRASVLVAVTGGAGLVGVAVFPLMAATEHGLAFALGIFLGSAPSAALISDRFDSF